MFVEKSRKNSVFIVQALSTAQQRKIKNTFLRFRQATIQIWPRRWWITILYFLLMDWSRELHFHRTRKKNLEFQPFGISVKIELSGPQKMARRNECWIWTRWQASKSKIVILAQGCSANCSNYSLLNGCSFSKKDTQPFLFEFECSQASRVSG